MANQCLVLGAAVLTLNGKPTKDSSFGKDVEFAMDLVSFLYCVVDKYSLK
jgi:hypothetical protein